ncbi:hypothetical protein AB0I39_30505 [Kitasatospora purpeofusca]|uniref:hypothetical protein n=1 Tax=Kitasatospora purpeofusca TaxID=67352 RepID=UPI0033E448D7
MSDTTARAADQLKGRDPHQAPARRTRRDSTAALAVASAVPAAAGTSATAGCTKYYKFDNVQVQVDNCSDGWVWIYTGNGTYCTGGVRGTDNFGNDRGELRAAGPRAHVQPRTSLSNGTDSHRSTRAHRVCRPDAGVPHLHRRNTPHSNFCNRL